MIGLFLAGHRNRDKPLCRRYKLRKDFLLSRTPLFLNALTLCDHQELSMQQIKFCSTERCDRAVAFGNQPVTEGFTVFFVPMIDKYNVRFELDRLYPLEKPVSVRVSTGAVQGTDLRADRDLLTK